MTKDKVAIIGVGDWGKNILKTVQNMCTVTSIGYGGSKKTKLFLDKTYPDIFATTEIEKIATDNSVTIVFIATPIKTHFEYAKLFLEHSKHVFVEKPLAITTEQVEELYTLAEKNNCTLFTGYVYLFDTAFEKLVCVTSGQKGELVTHWDKWGSFNNSIEQNLLVHEIATAYSLLGEVESLVEKKVTENSLTIQLKHVRGLSTINIDRKSNKNRKHLKLTTSDTSYTLENGTLVSTQDTKTRVLHTETNHKILTTECEAFLNTIQNGSKHNKTYKKIDYTVASILEKLSTQSDF